VSRMLRSRRRSPAPTPVESSPSTRYDEYLYDDYPITETHPNGLAAVAVLFGLDPAPLTNCRVLELGVGLGTNLIPIAFDHPESTFVGVDLSGPQIEVGRGYAASLGLRNIELHARNILEIGTEFGQFDYILCHGVYSWVPPEVQAKILEICSTCLTPRGLAYISYNTYPGWHLRSAVRDMLRREVGPEGTPAERVARAREFLRLFEQLPAQSSNPAQAWLKSEMDIMNHVSDKYIFYEHLVDINLPCYFSEFTAAATHAGLRYLGDAHVPSMFSERFGDAAVAAVEAKSQSIAETEQYLDFLELRYFRRSILCRQEVEPSRDVSWERLDGLWVTSQLLPASEAPDINSSHPETFRRGRDLEVESNDPLLKSALLILSEVRPRGLAFRDVCSQARACLDGTPLAPPSLEDKRALGTNLLALYARGHVELGVWSRPYVTTPGARPATTAFVQLQASRERTSCTNFRHESVRMDRFDQAIIRRLDGERTWEELAAGVIEDAKAGRVSIEVDGQPRFDQALVLEILEQKLRRMGRLALLTA
jgi:methyltransferase-like protein/2-polyprenyl-3-methyl-5-hydroxy-6-metoxy-1,4-benzoquinol methylase